jgi:hypothetical protein
MKSKLVSDSVMPKSPENRVRLRYQTTKLVGIPYKEKER